MFSFLKRHQLVKKGLRSPKVRRRRTPNEILESLETSPLGKWAIFGAFITGLAFLLYSGDVRKPSEAFFITLLIFFTSVAHLWIGFPEIWARNSRILLVYSICLGHLALVKGILYLCTTPAIPSDYAPLIIPYAFAPLVISVLLGRNQGIFAAIYVSLLGSIVTRGSVVFGNIPAIFIVISLISGFIAVFVTLQVRQRSRLIRAGLFVGLATWLLLLIFRLSTPPEFIMSNLPTFLEQSGVVIFSGVVTAILVSGALPILEGLFGITTDISWLELADLNHPLLKRMTIEAPGTYHHSLVVANLAEAACEAIGANATMARVCSYFHDIGKLVKPEYFTENMDSEHNPHDDLSPTMSALIIIAHVKEGIDLGLKYKLKKEIIDVIQQHHGTSLVWYFYKRALRQQEDARAGGKIMNIREEDIPEVREESFRYSGPVPQTRECAVISLADAVESASRSMEKVTPQKLAQTIQDIIRNRVEDGQLDDCQLTLKELGIIATSFKTTLLRMLHSRVAYPKKDAGEAPRTEGAQGESLPAA